jgi:tellurite resistance protein TehA-like permease
MLPVRSYIGLFFAVLAAIFLLLAVRRSLQHTKPVKALLRVGLIFAAVSLVLLLLNERHQ